MYPRVIKRALDFVVAACALPFFLLLLAVLGHFIHHEDHGPVFYKALRMGRHGRPFQMYKFRSMKVDAPDLRSADGSTFNSTDDPRQTRIGRFMRKTSIDELPQVLNVLKGQMSFIGPRPDDLQESGLYVGDEGCKLQQRPGISGYAQVFGRNAIAFKERVALDVYYVQHISFWLDLRIFVRTFSVVFSQQGVYVEGKAEPGEDATPDAALDAATDATLDKRDGQ